MEMRALITAAGMGKRFGVLTRKTNKSLFHVDGRSLIEHLLMRLKVAGIRKIYVVTGHQHALLKKHVAASASVFYNPFYRVSGILGSFWAAREALDGKPFLFTTSDHFFHPAVLRDCLGKKADLRIVVQKKKCYTKEDAKVIIQNSKVIHLSKDIPLKNAHGEFGGMVFFSARASTRFFEELEGLFQKGDLHGYVMDILLLISRKYAMPITYSQCTEASRIEVDSVHDLIVARRMAKKFKSRKG